MTTPEDTTTRRWSVGELAAETGLTVRTLHHYDELGLLVPSERTQAGHRRYGARDVERLYRILALRGVGLGLADIAAALDDEAGSLEAVVRRQLAALEDRIAVAERVREVLGVVLAALERAQRPSLDTMMNAIEVTQMYEKHYTPEQLDTLAQRREALGEDAIRAVEREWAEIAATLRAEMEAGTDPADPKFDPLRRRMAELVEAFTGGDEGIRAAAGRVWQEEDPATFSHGPFDRELAAYMFRVQAG